MTIPESEIIRVAVLLVGGALALLIAVVGYLLKRAIDGLDKKLDGLGATQTTQAADHAALRDRVTRLETRLDTRAEFAAHP